MAELVCPDVTVYVCSNSVPDGGRLPRQWTQDGAHVLVRQLPCSGKVDAQYLMHTLEGGGRGVCVVACPKGECELAQGNYRAEIRVATIRKLLGEIGLEPERVQLVITPSRDGCSADTSFQQCEQAIHDAVEVVCALGENPARVGS